MALVAFQGQGVIAALLNHLLRHLTLAVQNIGGNHFAPKVSISNRLGNAAISLDLVPTASCPSAGRFFSAQALTGCNGERCSAWS